MAQAADKAGAAAGGRSAAKKAAKDMKSATTGIDELNIINLRQTPVAVVPEAVRMVGTRR